MDYEFEKVKEESRYGIFKMMAVMLGFTFFSASMWSGGILGTSLKTNEYFIVVFLGSLILSIYTALLAFMGASTGLSTHLLSKYTFGGKGSYLPSFLLSVTQIGWFGVGVAMFSIPVCAVTHLDLFTVTIISGFVMVLTSYFGMKALLVLSSVAVPCITILGFSSVSIGVSQVGGITELLKIQPTTSMGVVSGIAVVVGSFISGGTLTADFTRYSKSPKNAVVSTIIAFFVGNGLMFMFGAVGAKVYGTSDISEVLIKQGLVVAGILILGLNIWTTNDNALYASGLGFSNITGISKKKTVLVNGIIGTLLALSLYNHFVNWLNILNVLLPPIGAILITDFYLINKRKYKAFDLGGFKDYNISAIGTYFLSVIILFVFPMIFGDVVPQAFLSMIVTPLIYVVLKKKNIRVEENYASNKC